MNVPYLKTCTLRFCSLVKNYITRATAKVSDTFMQISKRHLFLRTLCGHVSEYCLNKFANVKGALMLGSELCSAQHVQLYPGTHRRLPCDGRWAPLPTFHGLIKGTKMPQQRSCGHR